LQFAHFRKSSMKTMLALTPSGRPILQAVDEQGKVIPILGMISTAINKLIASCLPQRDLAIAALRLAQAQAQEPIMPGGAPHDLELSLALSTIADPPAVSRMQRVRDIIGFDQYDTFDLGWVRSLLAYWTSTRVAFPGVAQAPVVMPETVTFAVAGDWGTGTEPALSIGGLMLRHLPDYTVHLGDVYYSGLPSEENAKFVDVWPSGTRGALALNSNHEMYSGGIGYFNFALKSPKFALQKGLSYFALRNKNWLIIGLDTAYFADSRLYQDGSLGDTNFQLTWFRQLIAAASRESVNVIVLTHHDGFDCDPYAGTVTFKPLYDSLVREMQGVKRWYWYWGHAHAGIVYHPIDNNGSVVYPRCIGHGGIPWEPFPAQFQLNDSRVGIEWAEHSIMPVSQTNQQERARNGYLTITLSDEKIVETLYDETGASRYTHTEP
jgi:hypothetical protein